MGLIIVVSELRQRIPYIKGHGPWKIETNLPSIENKQGYAFSHEGVARLLAQGPATVDLRHIVIEELCEKMTKTYDALCLRFQLLDSFGLRSPNL